MEFEPVIGLEVHIELNTKTKIFCNCSTEFGKPPNTNVCPVCLGLPGVLPVFNNQVLQKAIRAALTLNCTISDFLKFDRKQYFYPDLPKNFQISQYDLPLAVKGTLVIKINKNRKNIHIRRVHMEEDAGKLIHSEADGNASFVDLNRTGVPLIEVVTEPDLSSPEEAYLFLNTLKTRLSYVDISDFNMEEGSLRTDVNISLRPEGTKELGVKTEIKNLNSFRAVEKVLHYEIKRQKKALNNNEPIIQETRLWDPDKEVTRSMRFKEQEQDYRYFPEPDLVPIIPDKKLIKELQQQIPELPDKKEERYITEYNLPEETAEILTSDKKLADFYEQCLKHYNNFKTIANWIRSELLQYLNRNKVTITELQNLSPKNFAKLVNLVDTGIITGKIGKEIIISVIEKGVNPDNIIEKKGLKQVSDESEIETIINEIIKENPEAVANYKKGKKQVIGFLVGQAMAKSQGKANPKIVNKLLQKKLS